MVIPIVTHGLVIGKAQYSQLLLSPTLPTPAEEIEYFLAVYSINPKMVRITCYPMEKSTVWKIAVKLQAIDEKALEHIGTALQEYRIIHTTGLCEKDNNYLAEYYLSPRQSWDQITQTVEFISQSNKIEDVKATEIRLKDT